jgi:hypothetical protein
MDEISLYGLNIEYLKNKFGLSDFTSIYKIVNVSADFIKSVDEQSKQSQEEKIECQMKQQSKLSKMKKK